jgi:hypothetical protein
MNWRLKTLNNLYETSDNILSTHSHCQDAGDNRHVGMC